MSSRSSWIVAVTLAAVVALGGSGTTPAGPASQAASVGVGSAPASGGLAVDDVPEAAPPAPVPGAPAEATVAPEIPATGALTIPRLGFDQPVVEELPWGVVLRPAGKGLAIVIGIPAPWDAGELLLVHSGGGAPGDALVARDGGSLLVVGDAVTLPDGSPGVVARAEVTPKDRLPGWLWTALADGQTVLVTCRPETGRASSMSNAVAIIERTT